MMVPNSYLLLKVSRPIFWFVPMLVFLLGLTYADAKLNYIALVQLFLLSFPFSVFLYGINDIYDYESDKLNPRKKGMQGIKLKQKYHPFIKKVSFFVVLLLLFSSILTLNFSNIVGMIMLLFFSYYYSAHPLRFKANPPMDSFSNGVGYFFAPFVLGFSFGGSIFEIPLKIYFISFCVMAVHSLTTIADYKTDKKVGDRTFAVVFGKKMASFFALTVFTITLLFAEIHTKLITYYLILCILLALHLTLFPSEKRALFFLKLIFLGFVISILIYIYLNSPFIFS